MNKKVNFLNKKVLRRIADIGKSILFIAIFALSFGGDNVFADGEVVTMNPQSIGSNNIVIRGETNIAENAPYTIRKVGFTDLLTVSQFSDISSISEEACNFLTLTPAQLGNGYPYGYIFTKNHTNLVPETTYYYAACAADADNNIFYGDVNQPQTSTTDSVLSVVTGNATKATFEDTEWTLDVSSLSQGVSRFGFAISTNPTNIGTNNPPSLNDLDLGPCTVYVNSAESSIYSRIFENLEYGTQYFYQGCARNTTGTFFRGEVKTFTTPIETEITSEDEQQQRNINCRIDYVEFLPFNTSLDNGSNTANPQFQNFINGQGQDIILKIHPEVANDCKNVPIEDIKILSSHMTPDGDGFDYVHDVAIETLPIGNNRKFTANSTFEIMLKAGNTDQNCKYIIGEDTEVCHSYVEINYGLYPNGTLQDYNIFKSRAGTSAQTNQLIHSDSDDKRDKGTLNYSKGSVEKEWDVFSTSDPVYNPPTEPTYDVDSPCYESNLNGGEGGYNQNCYELLASIPGIGETVNGRTAITDLGNYQLGEYVQSLFNVALGMLMVLSVIMIVIAGVEYMTIESIYGKSNAKKKILGAVTGLILALGIFLILRTINPKLLEINFGDGIEVASINIVNDVAEADGDGTNLSVSNAPATQICNNRKDRGFWRGQNSHKLTTIAQVASAGNLGTLEGLGFNLDTGNPQGTTIRNHVESDFAVKLAIFNAALEAEGINTRVTEAFGPSFLGHGSPCHYLGSCIDLATQNSLYPVDTVEKIIKLADENGLTAQFEFSELQSENEYVTMQNELYTRGIDKCMIKYVRHATNWHFSVYDKITESLTL